MSIAVRMIQHRVSTTSIQQQRSTINDEEQRTDVTSRSSLKTISNTNATDGSEGRVNASNCITIS